MLILERMKGNNEHIKWAVNTRAPILKRLLPKANKQQISSIKIITLELLDGDSTRGTHRRPIQLRGPAHIHESKFK